MANTERAASVSTIDLQDWLRSREGLSIRSPQAMTCGYCGSHIESETRSMQYASTIDLTREQTNGSLAFQRQYCGDCARDELLYPCRIAYEVLVEQTVTEEHEIADLEVVDVSPVGAGYDWSPRNVCQRVLECRPQQLVDGLSQSVGPASVVDSLALYGVPPEQVLTASGEIVDEETLQRVQEHMEFVSEKMTFRTDGEQTEWVREQPYPPTGYVQLPEE